jgi:hypothetical protein
MSPLVFFGTRLAGDPERPRLKPLAARRLRLRYLAALHPVTGQEHSPSRTDLSPFACFS